MEKEFTTFVSQDEPETPAEPETPKEGEEGSETPSAE